MRTATRTLWIMLIGALASLALACADPAAAPSQQTPDAAQPAAKDGKHFLADKPLKLFEDQESERWKFLEAIGQAEKRAEAYKNRHSAVVDPTSPDPLRGRALTLEEVLDGLPGDGAPKAVIETTAGTITCELLAEQAPEAVAHFVGLARGIRPWWDGTVGKWSTSPLYRAIPVYRVTRGEALYSGCPMAVGFAEVGFRTLVSQEAYAPAKEALTLALFAGQRVPSLGAQFLITAKPDARIVEKTVPIGRCDDSNVVQQIVNQPVTEKEIPINDIVVRDITITR